MKKMMNKIEPKPLNSNFNDEQWEAIQHKGSNILVSASAGSGKTTVLIERIFNHILQGFANVDELLVVTFTEAAANEMKERMESRLKDAVNETLNPEEQRRLTHQLSLLPKANIQTLHSFCLEIIQNFFYLIDFNPNFSLVTDQTQVQLIYQDVWDDMIASIHDSNSEIEDISPEIYQSLLARYGSVRSDEALFDTIIDIYKFARSQTNPTLWLEDANNASANFEAFKDSLLYKQTIKFALETNSLQAIKLLETATNLLHSLSDEGVSKYEPIIQEDLQQANFLFELSREDKLEDLFSQASSIQFGKWKANKKSSEDYEIVAELKELRDEAKDIITKNIVPIFTYEYKLTEKVEQEQGNIIYSLSQLAKLFMDRLAKHKTSINMIDYNDLEHLALDILAPLNQENEQRQVSSAAMFYHDKFKEIMIDEYQDINDIQNDILYFLSHETRTELNDNLFMVGDVKQSIYGFRMAEPSLFLNRYLNYANSSEDKLIILDKNYRSRDEILQFTNFVFERVMDSEFGEMNYGKAESLTTGNKSFEPAAPHEDFNIQLLLYEKENQESEEIDEAASDEIALADTSLEAESHIIAQDIRNKVAEGYLVYDKKLKKQRPVTFSDFVILTPTRKPFLIAQRILESYDVPIYAQKVENYFQRQEVQLMLALLKLIDNPLQDIPLVAILRSYFVQLDDEALSKIRIHSPNGLFYEAVIAYLNDPEIQESNKDIHQKLSNFFKQLTHWNALSKRISLVDLIWTIYQETSFLDYVAGLNNGVQREANLHALYEKALEFEQSQYKGVFGFIRYIEKVMQQQNDLAEPVLLDGEQNFVRLMTVHASKGLEFPIVYLMDTAKKFNLQDARSKSYIASKHFGISSDYYDFENRIKFDSFTKQAFKIEKENMLKAEEMRKLYVALTRCEQKLMIVGTIKNEEEWHTKQEATQDKSNHETLMVPLQERQSASSWLDWIRQAIAKGQTDSGLAEFNLSQINIEFIDLQSIADLQIQYQIPVNYSKKPNLAKQIGRLDVNDLSDQSVYNHMNQLFNYNYTYELATNTSSYQSVSELKRLYEEPRIDKIAYFEDRSGNSNESQNVEEHESSSSIQGIRYTEDTFQPPKFIDNLETKPNYAEIGSATHFLLQQLDFSILGEKNQTQLKEILIKTSQSLVETKHISKQLAELINYDSVITFIQSELGQLTIEHADRVKKEQAFSYLTPALKLFENNIAAENMKELSEDQLLIHGVIDNFIEFDEDIVIYDYKTDRYKPYANMTKEKQIEQIVNKYRFQISLYSKALTIAYNKPIRQAYIVLLDFGVSIPIDTMYQL
ncbi:helicase-exonuclease AddAB subunit AddA [Ruoffia tabacinasalis]|uniref:ATP-dependent helicase/nuclease subunit A n=2 Tax=Ruoffia tabacinasalis TaxID=87458 RepID=A0ABS0LGH5_9LACT|nr:helicase-exonuclease AddAB subunit AddA [Ruoffia tabacinasalis]